MEAVHDIIGAGQIYALAYSMIVITGVFCTMRFYLRYATSAYEDTATPKIEDAFVLLAFMSFVTLAVTTIVVTPSMYRLLDLQEGRILQYAAMNDDLMLELRIAFANTILLWLTLWSVKLSLLFLIKRVLRRQPMGMRWWWFILVFIILSFIGCLVTSFTRCGQMGDNFKIGGCNTNHDRVVSAISLYFSFAVDVITDFMIMILPFRIIWILKMDRKIKIGIVSIFSVGILCVVAAVSRIVTISVDASTYSQSAGTWLGLWGLIEGGIAVVIGCLPAFYPYFRRQMQSYRQRRSYLQGGDLGEMELNNLHTLQRSKTTNSITAHHGHRPETPTPLNGISVTTDFEVQRHSREEV